MSIRMTKIQIVSILKEAEAGIPVKELRRKYGIASWTFYNCKSKYRGMEAFDVKRLIKLEEESCVKNGVFKVYFPLFIFSH